MSKIITTIVEEIVLVLYLSPAFSVPFGLNIFTLKEKVILDLYLLPSNFLPCLPQCPMTKIRVVRR